jgi:hypothetical protein
MHHARNGMEEIFMANELWRPLWSQLLDIGQRPLLRIQRIESRTVFGDGWSNPQMKAVLYFHVTQEISSDLPVTCPWITATFHLLPLNRIGIPICYCCSESSQYMFIFSEPNRDLCDQCQSSIDYLRLQRVKCRTDERQGFSAENHAISQPSLVLRFQNWKFSRFSVSPILLDGPLCSWIHYESQRRDTGFKVLTTAWYENNAFYENEIDTSFISEWIHANAMRHNRICWLERFRIAFRCHWIHESSESMIYQLFKWLIWVLTYFLSATYAISRFTESMALGIVSRGSGTSRRICRRDGESIMC